MHAHETPKTAIRLMTPKVPDTTRVLSMAVAERRCAVIQSFGRVMYLEADNKNGKVMLQTREIHA